jgi:hypothetical protein
VLPGQAVEGDEERGHSLRTGVRAVRRPGRSRRRRRTSRGRGRRRHGRETDAARDSGNLARTSRLGRGPRLLWAPAYVHAAPSLYRPRARRGPLHLRRSVIQA